jgi:hypothetical protein
MRLFKAPTERVFFPVHGNQDDEMHLALRPRGSSMTLAHEVSLLARFAQLREGGKRDPLHRRSSRMQEVGRNETGATGLEPANDTASRSGADERALGGSSASVR